MTIKPGYVAELLKRALGLLLLLLFVAALSFFSAMGICGKILMRLMESSLRFWRSVLELSRGIWERLPIKTTTIKKVPMMGISDLIGLKDLPVKIIVIAGIISAVIAWDTFRAKSQFQRGYYKAHLEAQQAHQKSIEQRARENKKRLENALDERDKAKKDAEKLAKELAKKPKVTTRVIYEDTIDCDNLCPDAFRLFRDITEKPTGLDYRPGYSSD